MDIRYGAGDAKLNSMLKRLWGEHRLFIIICAAFSIVGAVLASTWYKYALNPDAASYFSIAHKYAHFDFRHALNGYWGPLISWLLVPAVWLHLNLIIAAKCLNILVGLAILITVYWYLRSKKASLRITNLVCLFLASSVLITAVFQAITPDLLLSFLILLLAIKLAAFMDKPSRRNGILVGLIGAAMYFAKGFGFYLFVATVLIVAAWQWYKSKKIILILKRFSVIAVVFLLLTLPFIAALSVKYHKPTINTAGPYDFNFYGPVAQGQFFPYRTFGPLAPPNTSATSAGEDPSLLAHTIPGYGWSPLDSAHNLRYFLVDMFGRNLLQVLSIIFESGLFLFGLGLIAMAINGFRAKVFRREYRLFGLISALMIIGYSTVYVEQRYLWGALLLASIATGLWATAHQRMLNKNQLLAAGLVVCGVAAIFTAQTAVSQRDEGKQNYEIAQKVAQLVPPGSKLMSDYSHSYIICYFLHSQCYGVLSTHIKDSLAYYHRLKQLGVNYYVEYGRKNPNPTQQDFLKAYFHKLDTTKIQSPVNVYQIN